MAAARLRLQAGASPESVLLTAQAMLAQAELDRDRATQADLETVKGIGPGLSAKILEARKSGDFKNWADVVDRVGGVGPGNAARFSQAGLTVGGAAYDGSAAADAGKKTAKVDKADKSDKPMKTPVSDKSSKP